MGEGKKEKTKLFISFIASPAKNKNKNLPSIDGGKVRRIINLPVTNCAYQHRSTRPGERNYRRCNPVAYRKHGINNGQADVSIACKFRIVLMDAVKDGFLRMGERVRGEKY